MPGNERTNVNQQVDGAMLAWQNALPKARRARPTVGLLIGSIWDQVSWDVWAGMYDLTQERDINLICFVGEALRSASGFEAQANVVYDLVGMENVDGLVVWGGGLGRYVTPREVKTLCERYSPIPVVSAALPLEGIPSVLVDNYQGMRDLVTHLVEVHGYRRIAFVRGPEGHAEADDRYRAYVDVLAESGLSLDPDLVAPGDFTPDSGAEAIHLLLDRRGLRPRADFEAIVVVDDVAAINAIEALQARGVQVPDEVAVVGFDDVEESGYVSPPLTTVPSLAYEQARRATEMVLALLEGEEVPERVNIPTRMVVRRSCGCLDPAVVQAAVGPVTPHLAATDETCEVALAARQEEIVAEIVPALGKGVAEQVPGWTRQFVEAFSAELKGEVSDLFFVSTLNHILRQLMEAGGDLTAWQDAISILRRHALPCLTNDAEALGRAEDLWQQARVLIGEMAGRVRAYRAFQAQQRAAIVRQIGQALLTVGDMAELMDVLARDLPRLDIPACYLSLYDDPESPAGWARLIMAYDESGRVELADGGRRFPARELAPDGMFRRAGRYSMLLEPLYFRQEQLGFLLFEGAPRTTMIHESLRVHISSALRKTLLVRQVESNARQLQTAAEVSRAAGSILDPGELIRQVVDLAREQFGLYYAGLFLVDETGEWAKLRAGTGEAGRQMVEQGHMLRVGGESMIGRCIANRQARIALDVGEEAVRFDNPLLPETRSELALPLVSRGEAIGALTIQSARESAFSEEDIVAFQTMADQLANAIENARLFEETQIALSETEDQARRLTLLNEMSEQLGRVTNFDEILDVAAVKANQIFAADRASVAILTPEGDNIEVFALHGAEGATPTGTLMPVEGSEMGIAMREKRLVIEQDSLRSGLGDIRSFIVAPLFAGPRAIGTLNVASKQPGAYTQRDGDLLLQAASLLSSAIENRRLFEDTRSRLAQFTALEETTKAMASTLELDELLDLIVQQATTLLQGNGGIINLVDWEKNEDEVVAAIGHQAHTLGFRSTLEGSLSGWVTTHNQAVISNQLLNDKRTDRRWRSGEIQAQNAAIAPLTIKDQVIGTLVIMDKQAGKGEFNQADLDLLIVFANQAAVAIENARLFDRTQAALEEVQATHRRYLEREWTEYLQAARTTDYDTDLPDAASLGDAALSEIRRAMERQDATVLTGSDGVGQEHSALVVPIALRGAVIGALGIHDDSRRQWTESEKALVEAVVGRMAQIAENLRLLEETQRTATRERLLGEVTDKMRRSGDVDALMRTVVREAAAALGTSRAFVQLGVASGTSGDEG